MCWRAIGNTVGPTKNSEIGLQLVNSKKNCQDTQLPQAFWNQERQCLRWSVTSFSTCQWCIYQWHVEGLRFQKSCHSCHGGSRLSSNAVGKTTNNLLRLKSKQWPQMDSNLQKRLKMNSPNINLQAFSCRILLTPWHPNPKKRLSNRALQQSWCELRWPAGITGFLRSSRIRQSKNETCFS